MWYFCSSCGLVHFIYVITSVGIQFFWIFLHLQNHLLSHSCTLILITVLFNHSSLWLNTLQTQFERENSQCGSKFQSLSPTISQFYYCWLTGNIMAERRVQHSACLMVSGKQNVGEELKVKGQGQSVVPKVTLMIF